MVDFEINDIPSSVDWRKKGVIHPVVNQGSGEIGSSPAFALVRGIDAFWAIQHGKLVSASIREFENCCENKTVLMSGYKCIVDIGGLALEGEYPDTSDTCQSQKYKPTVMIKGGKDVLTGNEKAMAEAVAAQPVVVAIDASESSFQLYREGVYSSEKCSALKTDHAMLVVGYGTYEGVDFWLCQNTWGKYGRIGTCHLVFNL